MDGKQFSIVVIIQRFISFVNISLSTVYILITFNSISEKQSNCFCSQSQFVDNMLKITLLG